MPVRDSPHSSVDSLTPVCLSVSSSLFLFFHLFFHPSSICVCTSVPCLCLSVFPFVHLCSSVHPSLCLFVHLSACSTRCFCPLICSSTCLCLSNSVCLFIHLPLSVCPQVCKQIWLGLYDDRTSSVPDFRESQKVKEFLQDKYEKKRW